MSHQLILSGFGKKISERQIRDVLHLTPADRIDWNKSDGASCTIVLGSQSVNHEQATQALAHAAGWSAESVNPSETSDDQKHHQKHHPDALAELVTRVLTVSSTPLPIKIVTIKSTIRGITYQRVCDEELLGGTKVRALMPLFKVVAAAFTKVAYGSPAVGGAQVAIAAAAKSAGISSIIYTNGISPMTKTAAEIGAEVVDLGHVSQKSVNAETRDRSALEPGTLALPFGLGTDSFVALLARELQAVTAELQPKRVWVVVGSSTVAKALARVFPHAHFCLVQVGKWLAEDDLREIEGLVAGVEVFVAPESFTQVAEIKPPYRSNPNYDAKLWRFFIAHGREGDLIWNVA